MAPTGHPLSIRERVGSNSQNTQQNFQPHVPKSLLLAGSRRLSV